MVTLSLGGYCIHLVGVSISDMDITPMCKEPENSARVWKY